jgi:hypothetical protein
MKLFKKAYYEKVFEKRETTIYDCYDIIRAAEKKIQEIRMACPHTQTYLGMHMWRPGAFDAQKICVSCDAVVPGITEEQRKKVWDEWNKGQDSYVVTTVTKKEE